jgi:GNAT superfamily N-acetyltransferase
VTDVEIRPSRFGAPAAQQLITAAQAELAVRYGGTGDDSPIEPVQFDPPEGCFLIAWRDGQPVACGGWRTLGHVHDDLSEDIAEIKRMYAVPTARGSGAATALLRALEEAAREAGMRHMWLETGTAQPDAIAFYTKNGYERITDYGYYKDVPDVRSFGREL